MTLTDEQLEEYDNLARSIRAAITTSVRDRIECEVALVRLVAEVRRLRKLANRTYTVTMDEIAGGVSADAADG